MPRLVYLLTPGGRHAPGGMAKIVDYEARYWPAGSDYRLKVLDTFGPGPKWRMPFFFLVATVTLFVDMLMRRVDLVHLNMSERLSICRKLFLASLAHSFRIPVVLHLHGAEFAASYAKASPLVAFLIRRQMSRCSVVICLGTATAKYVVQHLGLSTAKIAIVPNGVPDFGKLTSKSTNSCRFIFVGAVSERKGVGTLLEALAQPRLASSNWEATIIGGGDVEQQRSHAQALGIGDRIRFLGAVTESVVHAELRLADVCVLPSKNEGLPLAILEAMSFGCAIVATPVGDVPDAVKPSVTGILTPVGDVQALTTALHRLASDKLYCKRLGEGARRSYEVKFSIDYHLSLLKEAYGRCF